MDASLCSDPLLRASAMLNDAREQRAAFLAARGHSPKYLVIDPDSLRAIINTTWLVARDDAPRTSLRLMDMDVVVIPTDGFPLARVAGDPIDDMLRAEGATSGASAS